MKTRTLWQPWATLSVRGIKHVETRSQNTNERGRVAIHAAQYHKQEHQIFADIWMHISKGRPYAKSFLDYLENGVPSRYFGAVVGTVSISASVPIETLYGTAYDTPLERAVGDWSPGRFGWIMCNPIELSKPIPARGSQGWWEWDADNGDNLDCVVCPSSTIEEWAINKLVYRCTNENAGMRKGMVVYSPRSKEHAATPIDPPAWCPRRKERNLE